MHCSSPNHTMDTMLLRHAWMKLLSQAHFRCIPSVVSRVHVQRRAYSIVSLHAFYSFHWNCITSASFSPCACTCTMLSVGGSLLLLAPPPLAVHETLLNLGVVHRHTSGLRSEKVVDLTRAGLWLQQRCFVSQLTDSAIDTRPRHISHKI